MDRDLCPPHVTESLAVAPPAFFTQGLDAGTPSGPLLGSRPLMFLHRSLQSLPGAVWQQA